MKVLCIGNVVYDITMMFDEYPKENIKHRVEISTECAGGEAFNAAYLLSLWKVNTYFAGVIGNDDAGKKIINQAKNSKLKIKYLEINKKTNTAINFVLLNKKTNSRTVFSKKNNKITLTKKIKIKPNLILYDGNEYNATKELIEKNKNSIKIMDLGRNTDDNIKLAKYADYVICSKDFIENYTNQNIDINNKDSLKLIFEKLKEFKNIIITIEKDGALYQENNEIIIVPSINVTSVDSNGAGDVFHAAFVYSILSGFNVYNSILFSNITAALSTTKIGITNSIPDINKVRSIYKKCLKK